MEISGDMSNSLSSIIEKLEIQSDGVDLCFIGKHATETEGESFISDTSDMSSSGDGIQIFGTRSSVHSQLHMPMIQEIDLQDVDSCHDSLMCDNLTEADSHMADSVDIDRCGNLMQEEEDSMNSLICKFLHLHASCYKYCCLSSSVGCRQKLCLCS